MYWVNCCTFRCLFLLIWCIGASGNYAIAQPSFNTAPTPLDTISVGKNISVAVKLKGDFPDSAIQLLYKTYQQSHKANYAKGNVLILNALSDVLMQLGRYDSAQSLLRQALLYTNEKQLPEFLALVYNNLGNAYSYMSQYDSAAYHYFLALKYKEQFQKGNPQQRPPITYIYNNLSFAHFEIGNLEKSYYYLQKIRVAALNSKDTNLIANNYHNLGGYFFETEQWDSCAFSYRSSILWALSNQNNSILFKAYVGLGNLYDKIGLSDSSLYYSLMAYRLYQNASIEKNGYNILLCNIGNLYKQKKEFAHAAKFYRRVENDAYKTPKERAFLLLSQSSFYAAQGAYEKAYELKEQYYLLNDSLKSMNIAVRISDLESRYELSRRNQAMAEVDTQLAQQQLKTKTRNIWIWVLSITFCILIFITWIWQRLLLKRQKAESVISKLKSRIAGEEKERNRISHELHDSINSQLAAAKSYLIATENRYPQLETIEEFNIAKDILTDASSEVRNVAHNLAPDILLKDGVVSAISVFCSKLFASSGIECHVHAVGDFENLPSETTLNIYRIVQELCNNALKHSGADIVTVLLTYNKERLDIVVEDNGKGLPESVRCTATGIGLSGVLERVNMFHGDIEITTEPDVYTAFYISFTSNALCEL